MFRECINSTALTGEIPDSALGHICGTGFRGDISFVASARAFIAPRMAEGDKLTITFKSITSAKPVADRVLYRDGASPKDAEQLIIVGVGGSKETSAQAFKEIDEKFAAAEENRGDRKVQVVQDRVASVHPRGPAVA